MEALPALARAVPLRRRPRHRHRGAASGERRAASPRICAGAAAGRHRPRRRRARRRCRRRGVDDGAPARSALLDAGRRAEHCGDRVAARRWPAWSTGPTCNGLLAGRVVRLLLDAEPLDDAHRPACSGPCPRGAGAPQKAAWVDGFFSDGALLLIHDPELRGLLDAWVAGLSDERVHRRAAAGPAYVRDLQRRRSAARSPSAWSTPGARGRASRPTTRSTPSWRARRWPRWLAPGAGLMAGTRAGAGRAPDAPAFRWRLLLGEAPRSRSAPTLEPRTRRGWTEALGRALRRPTRRSPAGVGADRVRAGLGASAPRVARWLGDIRTLLPDQRRAGDAARRDRAARPDLDAARARAAGLGAARRPPGRHAGQPQPGDARDDQGHRARRSSAQVVAEIERRVAQRHPGRGRPGRSTGPPAPAGRGRATSTGTRTIAGEPQALPARAPHRRARAAGRLRAQRAAWSPRT